MYFKKAVRWNKQKYALKVRKTETSVWRLGVQFGFVLISVLLGWQFVHFFNAAKTTTSGPLPSYPAGIEGYLPISGLMGILDWIYQGTLNTVHPAATILFLIFIAVSLLFRKAFCGWFCPVGFLSENLARLGQFLFKKNWRLPEWLDIALRSLKYLVLGFFVWAIFTMSPAALHTFIESPYNKVVDIKMLEFFIQLSAMGLTVILVLTLLSVVIHSFWCRYLCPYGALVGLFSWLSPVKVRRDAELCTDCGLCDDICPARLPISKKSTVTSMECIGCTDCVTTCPVPKTLVMGTRKHVFNPRRFAIAVVAVFLIGYVAARVGGVWYNRLPPDEIRYHIARMHEPEYGHPGQ